MKILLKIILLSSLLFVVSCKQFMNPFSHQRVLAKVGDVYLYENEVASILSPDISSEDSLKLIQGYVDQWVKKQLKVREAELIFESSQKDIDRMVEEYRNSLMTYKVDQYYVDNYIDTLFTEDQIAGYYNDNKKDFVLDKNILMARVVKLPKSYRQQSKLRELMLSSRREDYQDFVDICVKNGFTLTEMNTWTDMSHLLTLLPTSRDKNYDYLLAEGKIHELNDNDNVYYIRTLGSLKSGDNIPIERVRDVIKRVIFNQRKQEILRLREDSLYRNAMINKDIIININ